MKSKLLIIDDDEDIRVQMKWALGMSYDVVLAEDRPGALDKFKSFQPLVVILDLGLPPHPNEVNEGLATLSELLGLNPSVKVIVITGQGEKDNGVYAVGIGAYDFFCKPVPLDELTSLLRRCFHVAGLEHEYRELQQRAVPEGADGMLGNSEKMRAAYAHIKKVAITSAPVLFLGESGTGKEMASLALHRGSTRKDGPFIAINCSAIPENLLESELFGHEKGSFTGAESQRKGLIESAAGGTLFLDEIGDIPLSVQVKLLRFLQEQRFQRVGGRQEIGSDARIVAATHVDLKEAIKNGRFREDLYFRLAVVVINMPPLRERGDDIAMLAEAFLQRFAGGMGKTLTLSSEAMRALLRHSWPGNVRELQNRIHRAVIMTDSKRITVDDLELDDSNSHFTGATLKAARETVERQMVALALKRHSGRISAAATELGISRPTLYELMEKLSIVRE